jgi:hypothetical protein
MCNPWHWWLPKGDGMVAKTIGNRVMAKHE